ncbi:MAG: ABC transporter permease [Chloroflexi bacterium]|nr:ABC transporter permease [Chloroflexota bacterium]
MKRFIMRRLMSFLPTVFIVTVLVYAMALLAPGGDPVSYMLGDSADPELVEHFRKELRLDDPVYVQYGHWIGGVLTGDLGYSIRTNEKMTSVLRSRMAVTLELATGALVVALLIALPIGIYSAARPNSIGDNVGTVFAIAGAALPPFWLGVMLIYVFAVRLGWLPSQGFVPFAEDPVLNLKGMILPMIMTGATGAANLTRQTRSAMLEVLRQDYIRTAYSKGLAEGRVLLRHSLKNAMIPVITVLGLTVARLLGGTAITEIIFGLPGLGQMAVQSAIVRDIPAIQALLVVFAGTVLTVNLLVDVAYGILDPRIRYA